MRGASKPLSPLLLAVSRAQSWAQVLRTYSDCQAFLRSTYRPTTAELQHGLARMPTSWATTLFYYRVIKEPIAPQAPDRDLVLAVLRQYKSFSHAKGIARVVDEDLDGATLEGAKAKIGLANLSGMWEVALATLMSRAQLRLIPPLRRTVLASLAGHHQWQRALAVLHMPPALDMHPMVVRPLVRCFGRLGYSDMALRLTAASLAAGYAFDASLFSALLTTLQDTRQWSTALAVAQDMQLFAATGAEGRKNALLFHQLVDCLYEADVYADTTVAAVVEEVLQRSNPMEGFMTHDSSREKQFRLCHHAEVFQRFQSVILPLSHLYSKIIRISRWYSRAIAGIVATALADNSILLVLDSNIVLQLLHKNLSLEHLYPYMKEQYPDLQEGKLATVVLPFTVVQEVHMLIWGSKTRLSAHARVLLWSRMLALANQPNVYALSLAGEFPSTSLGIITKLAYAKMPGNVSGRFTQDPDLRILNVCLSLQHYLRQAQINQNMGGPSPPEGIVLFSFLKYHVRRYCNVVKGDGERRMVLCTMDRRMSQAAQELGIRVFPNITDAQ